MAGRVALMKSTLYALLTLMYAADGLGDCELNVNMCLLAFGLRNAPFVVHLRVDAGFFIALKYSTLSLVFNLYRGKKFLWNMKLLFVTSRFYW